MGLSARAPELQRQVYIAPNYVRQIAITDLPHRGALVIHWQCFNFVELFSSCSNTQISALTARRIAFVSRSRHVSPTIGRRGRSTHLNGHQSSVT